MAPKKVPTPPKSKMAGDRPMDIAHAPTKRLGPQGKRRGSGRGTAALDRSPLLEGVGAAPKGAGVSMEGVELAHRTDWWSLERDGEDANEENVARRLFFDDDAVATRPPAWGDVASHDSDPHMSPSGGVGARDEAGVDGGDLRAGVDSAGHDQEDDDGLEGRSSSSSSDYEFWSRMVWWCGGYPCSLHVRPQ